MKRLKVIEDRLRRISLPALTRPPVGPKDPPTERLVCWATTTYAYSSIAHVRTILNGFLALADTGNAPACDVIARHLFEWTAHACYLERQLKRLFEKRDWKAAFDLYSKAVGGNMWLKNHGHKYGTPFSPEEIPLPVPIKKLVSAYAEHQTESIGKADAEDSYGFLSEHSHPNGACLLQYRRIRGTAVHFVAPPTRRNFGGVNRSVLEWLMFEHNLLALAQEDQVRLRLVDVMNLAVEPASAAG